MKAFKALKIVFGILVSIFAFLFLFLPAFEMYDDWHYQTVQMGELINGNYESPCILAFILVVAGMILNFIFTLVRVKKNSPLAMLIIPCAMILLGYFMFSVVSNLEVIELYEVYDIDTKDYSTIWVAFIGIFIACNIVFGVLANVMIKKHNKQLASNYQAGLTEEATPIVARVQATQPSTTDQILEYKKLLDAGIITQEEFDAKKKQILGI